MKEYHYHSTIEWTGNRGTGTDHYRSYERSHDIKIANKPVIACSSDPAFRGDKTRHNPEELLVSSLSSCHMLWYLHFCSANNVVVEEYIDHAAGVMAEEPDGRGQFKEVTLNPVVTVSNADMVEKAIELHKQASAYCFIANSVNFPVKHTPEVTVKT